MTVVSNATPLIYLAKIGKIYLTSNICYLMNMTFFEFRSLGMS